MGNTRKPQVGLGAAKGQACLASLFKRLGKQDASEVELSRADISEAVSDAQSARVVHLAGNSYGGKTEKTGGEYGAHWLSKRLKNTRQKNWRKPRLTGSE